MCPSRVTQQDASTYLPYSGDMKPEKAFKIIEEYKTKVEAVRTTQVMKVAHVYRSKAHQLHTHAGVSCGMERAKQSGRSCSPKPLQLRTTHR